jgi:hypothetical protein
MGASCAAGKVRWKSGAVAQRFQPECPLEERSRPPWPLGRRGSPARLKGMWSVAYELIDGIGRTVPGSSLLLPGAVLYCIASLSAP